MNNKSNGTAFEKEFAELLSEHGFWVHRMQDNVNGQPFDVIAAKNNDTMIFDCKDCRSNIFYLRRIEENQRNAMKLWEECGNPEGVFAVRYPDGGVFLFPISEIDKALSDGMRYIDREHAKYYGAPLNTWLERIDQL